MTNTDPAEKLPAPAEFALHAWVDESMHVEAGIYLLAAAVCDPAACGPVREELRSLRAPGEPKLHWGQESPDRRTTIIDVVAGFDMAAVVVVGTPMDRKKQERARAVCMESLAVYLDAMDVTQVYLEEREASLNARDQRLVQAIRGKKLIRSTLRIDTAKPSAEPMLWLPDIVAGAVGQRHVRDVDQYAEPLGPMITELTVPLR